MPFNPEIVGQPLEAHTHRHTWREAALYALGCGATEDELDLLLETRGPKVLPTFSVVVVTPALFGALGKIGGNMLTLVHGGQRCTVHRPIPPKAELTTVCTPSALYDKGKGALAVFQTRTTDGDGNLLFETEWQIFYRGEGGFGGERGPDAPDYRPPADRAPDQSLAMPTQRTQALLYRLSGDLNPIHSDPEVTKKAGFERPILHGLCTYGFATRAAVQALCDGDPDRLTSIEGRFSKPVFPGDTLRTDLWRMGDGEAYFTTRVEARDEVVINLGRVTHR